MVLIMILYQIIICFRWGSTKFCTSVVLFARKNPLSILVPRTSTVYIQLFCRSQSVRCSTKISTPVVLILRENPPSNLVPSTSMFKIQLYVDLNLCGVVLNLVRSTTY